MRIKRILCFGIALLMGLSLSGCMNREEQPPEDEQIPEPEQELVIYHGNSEIGSMLAPLAEAYSAEKGKTVTPKFSGSDFSGEVRSKNAAIYIVDTRSDLSGFHDGSLFSDFMNDSALAEIFPEVPAGLRLGNAGVGSFGIPLMTEGYGYIFDREMMEALFGGEASALIEDLRSCSYQDFESFVNAVETYISAPTAAEITVSGNKYVFEKEKTGKAASLTGVFALNAESTRAMEHLLSHVLAAKFSGRHDVMNATEEFISGLGGAMNAFREAVDMQTSHIAGMEGSISRGEEFTGGDYNYSGAVDIFTHGYALFFPGGSSDVPDFEKSLSGGGENLDIIPMKLPLDEEEITAAGMSTEKLQSSIVIGSRYYISLNPSANEEESAAARDFVQWIFGSENGRKAYYEAFGSAPYDFEHGSENPSTEEPSAGEESLPEESSVLENEGKTAPESPSAADPYAGMSNSLMRSVARYYAEGNWIPDMSTALPADFSEKVLKNGLSDFMGMKDWNDEHRKSFSETILSGWRGLITPSAVG